MIRVRVIQILSAIVIVITSRYTDTYNNSTSSNRNTK